MFYAALKTAGIDRDRGTVQLLRFHDLRHTFGTIAAEKFALPTVQSWMGHADVQTTMNLYGWVSDDAELRALADWQRLTATWEHRIAA